MITITYTQVKTLFYLLKIFKKIKIVATIYTIFNMLIYDSKPDSFSSFVFLPIQVNNFSSI